MNHDITHCKGIRCSIKEDCFRYKAYKEVKSDKYKSQYISCFIDGYLCEGAKKAIDEELNSVIVNNHEESVI